MSDDEAFPRGGSQKPKLAVKRKTADSDVLFGTKHAETSSGKSKKAKKASATKEPKTSKFSFLENLPDHAHTISFKGLSEGTLLLGMVRQVNNSDLVISLPFNLNGYVRATEVSDPHFQAKGTPAFNDLPKLTELFTEGQFVRCAVLETSATKDKKKLALSLRPSLVNIGVSMDQLVAGFPLYGSITSVEDHGCIVGFGAAASFTGFLPRRSGEPESKYVVGRVVEVKVASVNDEARTVQLEPREATARTMTRSDNMTLRGLRPGMLVSATVQKVVADGIVVTFLAFFSGTLTLDHLAAPAGKGWEDSYAVGSTIPCRVLFVDATKKSIGLSAAEHIADLTAPRFKHSIGDILEGCEVERIDHGRGLLLRTPASSGQAGAAAEIVSKKNKKKKKGKKEEEGGGGEEECVSRWLYAHISKIADERVDDNLGGRFKVGASVRCRVVGDAPMDAILSVSLKKSTLDQPVLRMRDLTAGTSLEAEAIAVDSFGVVVRLGEGLQGLLTKLHLGDVAVTKPQAKFKKGKKMKVRVLSVDASTQRVQLTAKPSLLASEHPLLLRYQDAVPDTVSHGFVTKIGAFGALVTFYNNVHGLLPGPTLRRHGVEEVEKAYSVGDVVKVKVKQCTPETGRLELTLPGAMEEGAGGGKAQAVQVEVGQLVDGVVQKIEDTYIHLLVKPSDAAAAAAGGRALSAALPLTHLTDHPSQSDGVAATIKVGDSLKGLLVLSVRRKKEQGAVTSAVVTRKPLLLAAADREASSETAQLPSSAEGLVLGEMLAGYVAGVTSSGVFVEFAARLSARAPLSHLRERYTSPQQAEAMFSVGQSVRCVVQKLEESGRFFVSLSPNALASSDTRCLKTLLQEQREVAQKKEEEGGVAVAWWSGLRVGALLPGRVTAVRDFGSVLTLKHTPTGEGQKEVEVDGFAVKTEAGEAKVGDEVQARVLDVDVTKRMVDVSLEARVVKAGKAKTNPNTSTSGGSQLAVGDVTSGRVVLSKGAYAVVVVGGDSGKKGKKGKGGGAAGAVGLLQLADYHMPQPGSVVEVGEEVSMVVRSTPDQTGPGPHTTAYTLTLAASATVTPAAAAAAAAAPTPKLSGASLEDMVGQLVSGKVFAIKEQQLDIQLNLQSHSKVVARVHVADVDVTPAPGWVLGTGGTLPAKGKRKGKKGGAADAAGVIPHPFAKYQVGNRLEARVLRVQVQARNALEPVSASNPVALRFVDLSLKTPATETAQPVASKKSKKGGNKEAGELAVGSRVRGVVTEVVEDGVWVQVSASRRGFVSVLDLSPSLEVTRDFRTNFPVHSGLEAIVMGVEGKRLDLSVTAAMAGAGTGAGGRAGAPRKAMRVGSVVLARVDTKAKSMQAPCVMLQLGRHLHGRVCATEVSDSESWADMVAGGEGSKDKEKGGGDMEMEGEEEEEEKIVGGVAGLAHGTIVKAVVLRNDNKGRLIDLSLRPSRLEAAAAAGSENETEADGGEDAAVAAVVEDKVPVEGEVVKGFVATTNQKGCFVRLSRTLTAFCMLKELDDAFVDKPTLRFPSGRFVAGRVTAVRGTPAQPRITISLKPSVVLGTATGAGGAAAAAAAGGATLAYSDFSVGQTVKGFVRRIEKFGVFVDIKGSALTGLCHVSQLADGFVEDIGKLFQNGDYVKAKVLKLENGRISLGLKASYFEGEEDSESSSEEEEDDEEEEEDEGEEVEEEDDEEEDEEEDDEEEEEESEDDEQGEAAGMEIEDEDDEEEEEDSDDDEEEESEEEEEDDDDEEEEDVAPAAGAAGFQWAGFDLGGTGGEGEEEEEDSEEDSEEESEDEEGGKKQKRNKKSEARKEEAAIRARELALTDGSAAPEAAEDFERLVVGSPNSSFLWLKYMAFQLSRAEVDQARAIAERGLKAVSFREEQERHNLWVALLNLEHAYGSKQSLSSSFERAVKGGHPKRLHLALVDIYEQAGQRKAAEDLLRLCTKKFNTSKKVWGRYLRFRLSDAATASSGGALLKRAMGSLPAHKAMGTTVTFAQDEFELGEAERGRTVFEGVLSSYPKRMDVWNVYIDKEVKLVVKLAGEGGDEETLAPVRRLFERVLNLNFSSKKMKFWFKKSLQFERQYGTEASAALVIEAARSYVDSQA